MSFLFSLPIRAWSIRAWSRFLAFANGTCNPEERGPRGKMEAPDPLSEDNTKYHALFANPAKETLSTSTAAGGGMAIRATTRPQRCCDPMRCRNSSSGDDAPSSAASHLIVQASVDMEAPSAEHAAWVAPRVQLTSKPYRNIAGYENMIQHHTHLHTNWGIP